MSVGDLMGWLAAALTLVAFLMRSMTALRVVAIAANLCFILYGAMTFAWPALALQIALLPCNLQRLWELRRGEAARVAQGTPAGGVLREQAGRGGGSSGWRPVAGQSR